jgi:YHS domain-containing protein
MKKWIAGGLMAVVVVGYGAFQLQPQARMWLAAATGSSCGSEDAGAREASSYDAVMSGVCRFSCATQKPYDEAAVAAQPGAHAGQLTRCPVSGVVFEIDAERPRVAVAGKDYFACCGNCAEKLQKHPERFLTL